MKKLSTLLSCVGFIIQYVVPIILFGDVIPYTHEGISAGLTGMGYIACGLVLYFLTKKITEWIHERPKSTWRGIVLSIFPIVWWLVIFLVLGWLSSFLVTFAQYWDKVIIFIVIGRGFYVASESVYSIDTEKKEEREG